MALPIHRSRLCNFTRVWEIDASTITNSSTMQHQHAENQVTWSNGTISTISITNDAIELQADISPKLEFTLALNETSSLNRLSLQIQLPQDGQAALVQLQLPMLENLTMALGSAPADAAKNEVLLSSSQSTLVIAELPCISNVADAFHDVDFVWDNKWMRWYMDEVLLLEEFIRDESARSKRNGDHSNVIVDMSVTGSAAKLTVKGMTLYAGNSSDPFCAPRHSTSSNCRAQTSFSPRLGSARGLLSVDEVNTYIDDLAAAFPLITKVEELGQSVEKRPLRAVCLGACYAPTDQKVPQALFTGMHHAREPISMMNLVYTIDLLTLDYRNGDLAALELLSSRQLWFFLVVNPDGYAHNEVLRLRAQNEMGQRKNAAPTCDNSPSDAGVDLNRNYDVCFARDTKGSSNESCGDDYNGPSAFSEPETQAVRDLVERSTSDFSVALNYHSFGKYFNLPYACQARGELSEANNSVFMMLAQEMAWFNGFNYGQSWKESNLYTVNGDSSDWMWQVHGIFAISPEVGPAFDVELVSGFWPSRDDVPQLSSELHYSNLYISLMAGPVYSLAVNAIQLDTTDDNGSTASYISVDVTISNSGLRPATAELVASMFINGTSASDAVRVKLEAGRGGSESLVEKSYTLVIPHSGDEFRHAMNEVKALYVVVRDTFSCHLFRVAAHFHAAAGKMRHSEFQLWTALPLPRCGTCDLFGAPPTSDDTRRSIKMSPICHEIKDVVFLEPIRTRPFAYSDNHAISAAEPSSSPMNTIPDSAANVAYSETLSAVKTADQQVSHPTLTLSSASWSDSVVTAYLASVMLLVVAALFFQCCCRQNTMNCARADVALKGRTKVQYSRVAEEGMDLTPTSA